MIGIYKNGDDPNGVIANWLRNRSTIEFLGLWEEFNNNNFNPIEFEGVKNRAGENAFTLSSQKWIMGRIWAKISTKKYKICAFLYDKILYMDYNYSIQCYICIFCLAKEGNV
ncbi:MAG: KilA-N domain-containing protein [Butyrivibrio sp.]|nr:KilA-N domain-containing protein [Butyrivibrio sp.]